MNIPNVLTSLRILVVPLVWFFWRDQQPYAAALCATVAALTDYFDGKLARSLHQTTYFGALFDPIADKFMVFCLFGLLAADGILPPWIFFLSTLRNVSQLLSIPVLLGWKKISFQVKPRFLPKFASAFSFVVIVAGLAFPGAETLLFSASALLAVLEVQILVTYWPRFFAILGGKHDTFE